LNANITGKGKLILGFALAGIVFSLLTTLSVNVISGSLGLEFGNSVQGIVSAMFSGDIMATVLIILTTITFGVFIWIFSYLGAMMKTRVTGGSKITLSKRPHIIGFLLMGAIGVGVFGLVDEVLAGANTSTSIDSFVGAITTLNIIGIISQLLAYAVLGFVVLFLGSKFQAIESVAPDVLKKF
jgi:hypothetical protein